MTEQNLLSAAQTGTTEEAVEATRIRRSTAQIAVDAIRKCKNQDAEEIGRLLVEQAQGMALDVRIGLDRALRRAQ